MYRYFFKEVAMEKDVRQINELGKKLFCALTLSACWMSCSNVPATEIPALLKEKVVKANIAPSAGEFSVKAELDRTMILSDGMQSLYLLVQFDVPEKSDTESIRPRLNCGIVIDRSGSMEEKNKLEFARSSAAQLVDSLTQHDNIAIVEYDDLISTLYPSSPVTEKTRIKKLINTLEPRGSTNLCGGMLQGIEEVKKSYQQGFISRVILLTDGLANQGITDPQQIAVLVRNARRQGISISAMGLGIDYDEDLLQMIAENGGGNYYYIESATQIAHIFKQELNTLTEAVADNIQCKFIRDDAIDSITVYGYENSVDGKTVVVPLSSLHSGEKRTLLLKVSLKTVKNPKQNLGNIEITYNGRKKGTISKIVASVSVSCTNDSNAVVKARNNRVTADALLIEADQSHAKYVELYESGRKDEAKKNIQVLSRTLTNANRYLNDTKILKKLEALSLESNDMDNADRDINLKKSYLKSNKQRLLYAQKGKRAKYILQSGDNGGDVEDLQRVLQSQNLYSGPIDGKYSDKVKSAVTAYQKSNGIDSDGVAGPSTLRSLQLY
jgi:Ca-activated chloride channel family protein